MILKGWMIAVTYVVENKDSVVSFSSFRIAF